MQSDIIYFEYADKVDFYKTEWTQTAQIDNIPDLVEIVKCSNWTIKNGYLYSAKYKKYLHRLVMGFFIGEEMLKRYTSNGYVVDHLNNNEPFNCCIDNLHLIESRINKAKGFTVDHDVENIRLLAGFGFYHLKNNRYQICVGFNESMVLFDGREWINVASIYINFENFQKCFIAAQMLLNTLLNRQPINLNTLDCQCWGYKKTISIELTPEEIETNATLIMRDDKVLFLPNNNPANGPIRLIHKPAKVGE